MLIDVLEKNCIVFSKSIEEYYSKENLEWWHTSAFSLDLAAEWKTALQSQGWKSGDLQLTPQRILSE